jgi:hypothetical protein
VVKQSCGEDYKATSLKTVYGAITRYLMELFKINSYQMRNKEFSKMFNAVDSRMKKLPG